MTENKRFTMEESEGQDTIYDNEGLDDYYHLGNDTRDVKALCDLLNKQEDKLKRIENEVKNCDIYRDNLKEIVLEIRRILW